MIDAKQSFLSQVRKRAAEELTAADMERLMVILSDTMEGFRVEELKADGWTANDDDLIASFVSSLSVQGRSQKTIDRYVYVISRFMKAAKTTARSVTVYHIRDWLAAEKKRGIQESTLEGDRTVLSSYFNWLFREGLIEKNPIVNVGVIKVPKKQKKTYSDIDFEKLNQCCETLRDRAIIHFLRSTGCRISEMCGLDRDTVDLEALECVVHGKGNKDRIVYLDSVAGMFLAEYLKQRTDTSPALFACKRGQERIQPNGVRAMLKKLGRAAGVDHVHPHKFRRTLATDLARHGMPIQEVANLLGHEKLDTTMRYVVLNREDTKFNYRRYA